MLLCVKCQSFLIAVMHLCLVDNAGACHMEHLLHMMLRKVKHLVSVLLGWVIKTPLPLPDCSRSDLAVNPSQV